MAENEQAQGGAMTLGDAITNDQGSEINLESIYEIPVEVTAVLGKTVMPVSQLLKLGRGAVIELDKKVGETVDIFVNGRLVARGEVVIAENHVGVTMTEIIKPDKNSKK